MACRNDFVALILTHGRADHIYTVHTLRRCGYTGNILFVLDDEDDQRGEYEKLYGKNNIEVFNKAEIATRFDEMAKGNRRAIVYARNAAFDIAKRRGYRYFVELDDDYMGFWYRYDNNLRVKLNSVKDLDSVFGAMVDFLSGTPENVKTIAFVQNGDLFGIKSAKNIRVKRKAMNSFFCDVERRFWFIGRINEDVNTYVLSGNRGDIFLTMPLVSLNQKATQQNSGGMTDLYLDSGTYQKSMFSVMALPSAVKCTEMISKFRRLHHKIKWEHAVPCIINEKYRKL